MSWAFGDPNLVNWTKLNEYLATVTDYKECERLLGIEFEYCCREQFIYRLFHRRNRLRYIVEERELRAAYESRGTEVKDVNSGGL